MCHDVLYKSELQMSVGLDIIMYIFQISLVVAIIIVELKAQSKTKKKETTKSVQN